MDMLEVRQAEYVVKRHKSHSKVGAGNMMDVQILSNEAFNAFTRFPVN